MSSLRGEGGEKREGELRTSINLRASVLATAIVGGVVYATATLV
jgi:hypothetical protein